MLDSLQKSLLTLSSGLQAYSKRIETTTVNLANMRSLPASPTEDPYTRQLVTFQSVVDDATGATVVKVRNVIPDKKTPYKQELLPGHPAADENGYVKTPNVDFFNEQSDFQEGTRIYGDLSAAYRNIVDLKRLTIQMIPA